MVTALKVSATPSFSSACKAGAAIGASVKTKDSIVAMSGAIMPAPLAMPAMVTVGLADLGGGGGDLRKRVGRHDRLGGVEEIAGLRVGDQAVHHAVEGLSRSSGSPITPVEARKISLGLAAVAARAAICAVNLRRVAAALAGEGVGVAGIDHQRARFAALQSGAAPFDRRRRAFRAREHAGDRRALVEAAPAARRCGPCSGCRPARSQAARRRSPACRARAWARGEK